MGRLKELIEASMLQVERDKDRCLKEWQGEIVLFTVHRYSLDYIANKGGEEFFFGGRDVCFMNLADEASRFIREWKKKGEDYDDPRGERFESEIGIYERYLSLCNKELKKIKQR